VQKTEAGRLLAKVRVVVETVAREKENATRERASLEARLVEAERRASGVEVIATALARRKSTLEVKVADPEEDVNFVASTFQHTNKQLTASDGKLRSTTSEVARLDEVVQKQSDENVGVSSFIDLCLAVF
jgi:chromosome segregation ATPase